MAAKDEEEEATTTPTTGDPPPPPPPPDQPTAASMEEAKEETKENDEEEVVATSGLFAGLHLAPSPSKVDDEEGANISKAEAVLVAPVSDKDNNNDGARSSSDGATEQVEEVEDRQPEEAPLSAAVATTTAPTTAPTASNTERSASSDSYHVVTRDEAKEAEQEASASASAATAAAAPPPPQEEDQPSANNSIVTATTPPPKPSTSRPNHPASAPAGPVSSPVSHAHAHAHAHALGGQHGRHRGRHGHGGGTAAASSSGSSTTDEWSPLSTGPGTIPHNTTTNTTTTTTHVAIRNPDSCLRLLRKFLTKSAPSVPESAGGSMRRGWMSYLFGGSTGGGADADGGGSGGSDAISGRAVLSAYRILVDVMEFDPASSASPEPPSPVKSRGGGGAASDPSSVLGGGPGEADLVVESVLGTSGDSLPKARGGLAAFVHLVGIWCRASPDVDGAAAAAAAAGSAAGGMGRRSNASSSTGRVDPTLVALAIDSAQSLVAHGCLDGVVIEFGGEGEADGDDEDEDARNAGPGPKRTKKAIELLAESVFLADLSSERTELSALKFLLTTGCRTMQMTGTGTPGTDEPSSAMLGEAMLRGTHLLQTIRVCYHVYLKTASEPNKTTARAALRQLVASVFTRMERRNELEAAMGAIGAIAEGVEKDDNASAAAAAAAAAAATAAAAAKKTEAAKEEEEKKESASASTPQSAAAAATTASGGDFPSPDHRDAFLVLRSLCKLSMRNLPTGPSAMAGGGGYVPGIPGGAGGAASWDEGAAAGSAMAAAVGAPHPSSGLPGAVDPMHGTTVADGLNPAFESKILALDLLLYVLSHTSTPSLLNSGPQFAYAVRHYLCVSLLKNCTSTSTTVVNLSLRLFVPLIRHYRSHLKTEIEAFVTNVFFVILDSENSTVEHKSLVVTLFEEICSDQTTLAEIFLNYDCDLSAVDLFQRIVNTLARVAKIGLTDDGDRSGGSTFLTVAGAGAARAERTRQEHRELRLDAMKAVRTVLQSLHASIVAPVGMRAVSAGTVGDDRDSDTAAGRTASTHGSDADMNGAGPPTTVNIDSNGNSSTLVQVFDSKKRRREEEARVILRFNQKPSSGITYAGQCGHIDPDDAIDVAQYLLRMKDAFEKTQIGEYLGREPDYQGGFALKVLHAYVDQLNFEGMVFDDAIRFYLSGFRLPGEAQKIDRIMEKFAERYSLQNPNVFPNADVAFILAFSIIMLNTDLHNPSIKEERRMTKEGFIRNNRGISDGGDLPEEFLIAIFDRIRENAISLKEDDEARERTGEGKDEGSSALSPGVLNPSAFFSNHYVEMDRTRETNFQKERDQIVRNTESLLKRKKRHYPGKAPSAPFSATASKSSVKFVRTEDSGLRDEYVSPMFEVTWAPALAVFSTAMESANGTAGALASIASDDELELATKNAAEAVEVCLNGFQLAICTAGLCGNDTARSAFVHALENFSLLGTGRLMEYRHVRCVQTLLRLGRDDGELLGNTWEHIFRALSEVARLRNLYEYMARNDRAAAAAAERRQKRLEAREAKRAAEAARMGRPPEDGGQVDAVADDASSYSSDASTASTDSGYETDESFVEESEMDKRAIDESNATSVHEAVPETLIDAIYQRSTTLSVPSIKDFVFQLCRVSRMEISGYGGHVGSNSNTVDLTAVHYRQQHTLLTNRSEDAQGHYNQPDIYSLQKLVEVAHYNMDSRPRLVFADIWTTVSAHLTSTALHSNFAVATYAVDSFRQLSIQFLQREELEVYEFQRKFLKPLEAVMARCEHTSVKELLLKCVEQIIVLFGSESTADGDASEERGEADHGHGALRSGWRPVLKVLGLAGRDADDNVAETGFKMLTSQLDQCLGRSDSPSPVVLRAERFVDLVDALLMYVSGPREDKSVEAIDRMVALSDFLADDKTALPLVRQGKLTKEQGSQSQELELWWPILLGLSRAVGDPRRTIRTKSLVTLLSIINQHFFPSRESCTETKVDPSDSYAESEPPQHGDLQTLQLLFRGVLTPMLEHAETRGSSGSRSPIPLPADFERFVTVPTSNDKVQSTEEKTTWLETTFDHLMDGCVSLCLKSIGIYQTDCLVEEVLGMFNSCLISDSGALAVSGLLRLQKFVVEDLDKDTITDDFWATVCHMLRRCLNVRGLPGQMSGSVEENDTSSDSKEGSDNDAQAQQQEALAMMNEFVLEEELLADRRYIGSNAVMIIGSLLGNRAIVESMGLRWYVFLGTGLGRGIEDWEQAARIMTMYPSQSLIADQGSAPPHYLENSLYGRKYMVKFLIYLVGKEEVLNPEKTSGADSKPSATAAKNLIKEQSEALLSSLLLKESTAARGAGSIPEASRSFEVKRTTDIMCDLLDALRKLDDARLFTLAALTPTFSACMQSKNEGIRERVHGLVQRMFKGPLSDRIKSEGKSPIATKKKAVAPASPAEVAGSVPPPPVDSEES